MDNRRNRITTISALAFLLTLGASSAFADIISFNLTTPNVVGLDCCTGPYATVTVNRADANDATVTFDSLTNGGFLYLMAGNSAADLNVNGAFTLGSATGTNSISGFTPGPYSNGGSGNVNGFGTFNLNINSFDGFQHSATEIVIGLSNTTGLWTSASNVLAANGNGSTAAIHGFACSQAGSGCSTSTGAFATGYASNGAEVTPEPTTLPILMAFGGLMALVLRFRKRSPAN